MYTARMFDQFASYFPRIADRVIKYYSNGHRELIVSLDDGAVLSFDSFDNSYRTLPSDPFNMTQTECAIEFGYRLRKKLEEKHMTQMQLSEKTGIAQYLLSDYINGVRLPKFHNVDRIAKALGCSVDEFRYI